MDKYGTLIAPNTIRFERLLPGPIERVWAYLTDSEKRAKWLASGPMELRVGGDARLTWLHTSLDAAAEEAPERYRNGHSMEARITQCDPPFKLGFTWGADPARLSEVVFELTEVGNEVRMVLTHHRLPDRKDLLGVSGGWHTHLDVLVEHLNGRTAPGFWSTHAENRKVYEARIEASE
ncbi:MAG: SRPBCC family protein [Flavobacteriales bacterium]|nr:SRPBCC family protein [Flavobacteriales bacterium]